MLRGRIRFERDGAQAVILSKSFIISEQKRLVFPNGAAQRPPEFVSLKLRDISHIEIISGVERIVSQKFVGVPKGDGDIAG